MVPIWLQAGFWGLVGGSALLGAVLGYCQNSPTCYCRDYGLVLVANLALSFELMDEACISATQQQSVFWRAAVYTAANSYLARAKDRKHW